MIKLRIKIKTDSTTFTHVEFLPDEYIISKNNEELQRLVQKICDESHFKEIQDVKLYATFEW